MEEDDLLNDPLHDVLDDTLVGAEKDLNGDGGIVKKVLQKGDNTIHPEEGDEVSINYVSRLSATGEIIEQDNCYSFHLGKGSIFFQFSFLFLEQGKIVAGLDKGI